LSGKKNAKKRIKKGVILGERNQSDSWRWLNQRQAKNRSKNAQGEGLEQTSALKKKKKRQRGQKKKKGATNSTTPKSVQTVRCITSEKKNFTGFGGRRHVHKTKPKKERALKNGKQNLTWNGIRS